MAKTISQTATIDGSDYLISFILDNSGKVTNFTVTNLTWTDYQLLDSDAGYYYSGIAGSDGALTVGSGCVGTMWGRTAKGTEVYNTIMGRVYTSGWGTATDLKYNSYAPDLDYTRVVTAQLVKGEGSYCAYIFYQDTKYKGLLYRKSNDISTAVRVFNDDDLNGAITYRGAITNTGVMYTLICGSFTGSLSDGTWVYQDSGSPTQLESSYSVAPGFMKLICVNTTCLYIYHDSNHLYFRQSSAWGTKTQIDSLAASIDSGRIWLEKNKDNAILFWEQSDGTYSRVYYSRYNSGSWSSPALVDSTNVNQTLTELSSLNEEDLISITYLDNDTPVGYHAVIKAGSVQRNQITINQSIITESDGSGNMVQIYGTSDLKGKFYSYSSNSWGSETDVDSITNACVLGTSKSFCLNKDGKGIYVIYDTIDKKAYGLSMSSSTFGLTTKDLAPAMTGTMSAGQPQLHCKCNTDLAGTFVMLKDNTSKYYPYSSTCNLAGI